MKNSEYVRPSDEELGKHVTDEMTEQVLENMWHEIRIPSEPAPPDPDWMTLRRAGR